MMNNPKRNRYSWLKAMYVLPVVAVSLFASAKNVTDYKVAGNAATASPKSAVAPAPMAVSSAATMESIVQQKVARKDTAKLKNILVVVDGKEFPYSKLENLDPSSIASITIVKDKARIAKYGPKGANGVIVVTTKKTVSTQDEKGNGAFDTVDEMPQFNGGSSAMMQYLAQNVKYPAVAKDNSVQGRVVVSFIVKADGSVANAQVVYNGTKFTPVKPAEGEHKDVKVKSSVTPEEEAEGKEALAQEALRVVSSMPAWTPGKKDGKPVNVKYNIPISFRMN